MLFFILISILERFRDEATRISNSHLTSEEFVTLRRKFLCFLLCTVSITAGFMFVNIFLTFIIKFLTTNLRSGK